MTLRIEFDNKTDAIYIYFSDEAIAYTKKLDDMRYIDYASDNTLVGIELLSASNGVITDDLPHRAEIERVLYDKGIKVYA